MHPATPARAALALAAAAALLTAGSATAADGECRTYAPVKGKPLETITTCQQDVFVHTADKVGNLRAAGLAGVPSWDTKAPTASVQSGAGGGYAFGRVVDIALPGQAVGRPQFAGTYTGVLDTLAADLFLTFPVGQNVGGTFPLLTRLSVDGVDVYDNFGTAAGSEPEATITEAGTNTAGAIGRMAFTFEGLAAELAAAGLDNDADTEHQVVLEVLPLYYGDGQGGLLYDTTEVPTGLSFNPTKSKGTKLLATEA